MNKNNIPKKFRRYFAMEHILNHEFGQNHNEALAEILNAADNELTEKDFRDYCKFYINHLVNDSPTDQLKMLVDFIRHY